jgi:transglutaminase-like putative cysteine protease
VRVQRAWNGAMRERTPCGNGSFMANTGNIRAAFVWSILCRLKDAIGVSVYGAAAFVVLSAFVTSLALAEQPYEPPISVEHIAGRYIVNVDGSFHHISEQTLRIETPQAIDSMGAQRVSYSSSRETIESIEAWIIQPDGTKIIVPPESIRTQDEDTAGGSSKFSDTKYKVVIFPQVRVGSRLYWKYESFVHTPLFAGQFFQDWTLSPLVRVDHWEVEFTLPAGKALYVENRGVDGGLESRTADADHYRFTHQQLASVPPDEAAVSEDDYADLLRVSTLPDVLAIGRLYQANAAPKAAVTDIIRARALTLTTGLTGEREKARALYDWVSRNIRYVGVYLGSGGYVPHSADEVLANEYGDCKDHVVLLEALLAAAGIDSVPALINTDSSYTLPKVGSFASFTHVITYLPSLDLYVDSTAQFAPFGVLPFGDTDKPVALTSLDRLGRTPRMRADLNVTRTKVSMSIHSDGTIEGTSMANMSGTSEISSRSAQFSDKGYPEDRVVKGFLSRFGETGSGSISHVDPEDIDKPYWVEARFQLDPIANIPGRGAMRIPVGLAPGRFAGMAENKITVSQQQHPWPCTSQTISESYSIQFPSNVSITSVPQGVMYRDDQIDFQSTYRRVGHQVFVERTLVAQRPSQVCNAEDLEHWRAFHLKLQRDLRAQIFYR